MANRTMQAKAHKLRRQRRAWAKPLAMSNSPVPNKGVLAEYKHRVEMLGVPEYEVDDLIRKYYGRDPFKGTPAGKAEVNQILKEMEHHVPSMQFVEIWDNCMQRTLLYFNSTKTRWVITRVDKKTNRFRRSKAYPDKERILRLYNGGQIVWVQDQTLTPTNSG